MYYSTNYDSPLGQITLASDGEHLVGVWIEGQKYFCGSVKEELLPKDDLPEFEAAKDWLNRYFAGEKPKIDELPLAPLGGEFRQEVWKLLARKAAEKLGKQKMSAQAVGGAVGHNPISIIIPCHRVVGANGSLTGYGGGIQKKVWLLSHEGADMKKFTIPTKGTAL